MSLTAGSLSQISVGQLNNSLAATAATGGIGPYTYQWYRSLVSGFTPGPTNLVAGATALTLQDSGLTPGEQYYYNMVATDTGNSNATVQYTELPVLTLATLRSNYSGAYDTQVSLTRQAGYQLIAVTNIADLTTQMAAAASHGQRKFTVTYNVTYQPQDLRKTGNNRYGNTASANCRSCHGCGTDQSGNQCRCSTETGPLWPAYRSGILAALYYQDIMENEVTVNLNTSDQINTAVDLIFHF
jgi:cytochrome c553